MKRQSKQDGPGSSVTVEAVRALVRQLPGTGEGSSYGTLGYRVGGKLFARHHQDGQSLVVRIEPAERAMRMRADPETYYITDHYRDYPWMLVRLAVVDLEDLRELLEASWRLVAPRKFLTGSPEAVPARGRKRRPPRDPRTRT